jgi:hypothetical protein
MPIYKQTYLISIPKFGRPAGLDITNVTNWRRMKWARSLVRMGEKRNAYRFLVGNPEKKRPL